MTILEMTDETDHDGRPQEWPDEAFLGAVEEREPAGTAEVAEAVGCSYETAYKRLVRLEQDDELTTKTVGGTRIWTT